MLTNIRQGIVRKQESPPFLSFSSGTVSINASTDSTVIAFAHGNSDYLYSEDNSIVGAWTGPFSNGTDYWLYWDINLFTGVRTFGSTTIDPFTPDDGYGNTLPQNPVTNQHFFHILTKKMMVWSGSRWEEVVRVFAAKLANGSSLEIMDEGSQVGLTRVANTGFILFDDAGNPVKRFDRFGKGEFLTTESYLNSSNVLLNSFKLETLQIDGKALEPIPKFYCVSWKGPKQLGLASSENPDFPCVGIAIEDIVSNEIGKFVTHGLITNPDDWNWTEAPNTLIWVGSNGEITTQVPQKTSMQRIGHIVSADTVLISLTDLTLIEPIITEETVDE